MTSPTPHFRIPLNLPHAGTVALRLLYHLQATDTADAVLVEPIERLITLLDPYRVQGENPSQEEARRVVAEAASLGRAIVDEIERRQAGSDRLGQAVRNLFECLELGEEGARISLRVGENPNSALRP